MKVEQNNILYHQLEKSAEQAKEKIDESVREAEQKLKEAENTGQNAEGATEKIKAVVDSTIEKIKENAEAAKEKIEEKIPGIGEQTAKLGEELSKEATLIYSNTLKGTVDSVCQSIKEAAAAAKEQIDSIVHGARASVETVKAHKVKHTGEDSIEKIKEIEQSAQHKITSMLITVNTLMLKGLEKVVAWERQNLDRWKSNQLEDKR